MKFGKKKEKMSEKEELKNQNEQLEPESDKTHDQKNENTGNDDAKAEQQCPDAVVETMESLQLKVNEWQDKYTRLFADFENYKKRMRQERFDLLQSAGSELMLDVLPVIDDFERGLASLDTATDIDAVKQGYELIYNKLLNILKQKGLEPMESANAAFDTDFHEAITMVDNPDMKGKVVDVIEKGYNLRGKVLRYAKVVVGK
ncbi:Protein GrpE [bioreactor metagenome]|uniref:Protein GrpE n=1 Tax=bioreactor metagenome TaxID=1076179 RepID=A0A645AKB7_9ZZZZ